MSPSMSLVFELATIDGGAPKKDNVCSSQLWLAPSSLVTASLSAGDLVLVGVLGPGDELSNLAADSAARCSVLLPNPNSVTKPGKGHGTQFVVASVWPFSKLTRTGARLSRQLADSCGRPLPGTRIQITPLSLLPTPPPNPSATPVTLTTPGTVEAASVTLLWCRPIHPVNNIAPPPPLSSSSPSLPPPSSEPTSEPPPQSTTESTSQEMMTPGKSPRPAAWQPRGRQQQQSPQTPGRPPPPRTPNSEKKVKSSPARSAGKSPKHSDPGPSAAAESLALPVRTTAADLARWEAVGAVLTGGVGDDKKLVEKFAARWLWGRDLIVGNTVTVPICGQDCLFQVVRAEGGTGGGTSECAENWRMGGAEDTSSVDRISMWRVGHRTAVVFVGAGEDLPASNGRGKEGIASAVSQSRDEGESAEGVAGARFSELGGLANQIAALRELVDLPLKSPELFQRFGIRPPRGVLLYGPPGTGKTTLARAVATECGASMFTINGPEIVSQFYGESEHALGAIFESARKAAPSVVFIDELDAVVPARADGSEELTQRMVGALLTLMDGNDGQSDRLEPSRVVIIAATNRPEAIDPALRRPGRFDREIEIGVPTPAGRHEILSARLAKMAHALSPADVAALAGATHGFVGADLAALCNVAALNALRRSVRRGAAAEDGVGPLVESVSRLSLEVGRRGPGGARRTSEERADEHRGTQKVVVSSEDFEVAKARVGPSAMREVMIEVPKVRWEDVGGQGAVKQRLQEAVEWPQKHPEAFARVGACPSAGILLYGPPGCSKTLLARAVATEAGLNFISVKGPELFSKWVGESEKGVRALFSRARSASPAIIFLDEVDSLVVRRGADEDASGVNERVLSQLLQEMDGLNPRSNVTVLAATNRPQVLDPALLRPGRFDRLLYVGAPDEAARREIFAVHLRSTPLADDVDVAELARRTHGHTGADVSAVCREAAMAALEEDLRAKLVSMRHFDTALTLVAPSNPPETPEWYAKFQRGAAVDI